MPDISMCAGDNCADNYQCYRFRAKPSEQAYMMFPGRNKEECHYFVPLYVKKPAPKEHEFNDYDTE